MRRFDPWLAGLAMAGMAVVFSLAYLGTVVVGLGDEDGAGDDAPTATPGPGTPTAVSTPDDSEAVVYAGVAPERFVLPGFQPAVGTEDIDIRFGGPAGEPLNAGYFVPVAAWWTGVDALTSAQLQGLMTGSITDWSEVGGQAGAVAYFGLDEGGAEAAAQAFAPGATASQRFATTDELLAALAPGSGAIALIPLERITVDVSAVALDGIDLARGRGDAVAWPIVESVTVEALSGDGEAALAQMRTLGLVAPEVTTVVATGDYLPVRCSLARIEATGDWTSPFKTTLGDFLRSADLTLSSQDGSIQDLFEPLRCTETVNLTSPPGAVDGLLSISVDGVTVATNHIFDCGQGGGCGSRAFERTLELLHAAGIKTSGGGLTIEEAFEPAIFEVNGLTIGLLSFDDIAAGNPSFLAATETSPGTAPMDDNYDDEYAWNPGAAAFYAPAELLEVERMTALIAEAKAEVDFLIVMFNSGTEDTHDPSVRSLKALRAAAESGADLVLGNQAHHAQAAEIHNGVFVAYALGNFVYDQVHTPEHTQGYLVETSLWQDRVAAIRLIPHQIYEYYRPEMAEGELRTKILGDVWGAAENLPAPE